MWVKWPRWTCTRNGAGGWGNADRRRRPARTTYVPAPRRTRKRPSFPEWTTLTRDRFPRGWMRRVADSAWGAQLGWGAHRCTGHVGPATTRPRIAERETEAPLPPQAPAH